MVFSPKRAHAQTSKEEKKKVMLNNFDSMPWALFVSADEEMLDALEKALKGRYERRGACFWRQVEGDLKASRAVWAGALPYLVAGDFARKDEAVRLVESVLKNS